MTHKIFTAVFLFLLISPVRILSAPTGDIGNPFLWKNGIYTGADTKGYTLAMEYYIQNNEFLRQRDSIPSYLPGQFPPEERHREVGRFSDNKFVFSGLTTGIVLDKNYHLYFNFGMVNSEIDFNYFNEMVVASNGVTYATRDSFKSDSDLYYGIGASAILHDAEFRGSSVKTGLDVKYKRFSMEDDRLATQGRAYECAFDEYQLSLSIAAMFKNLSFYGGFKVSAYTGDEKFTDIAAGKYYTDNIYYDNSIDTQTYIGALFGVTVPVKEWFAFTVETHIVDEVGYAFSCMAKF